MLSNTHTHTVQTIETVTSHLPFIPSRLHRVCFWRGHVGTGRRWSLESRCQRYSMMPCQSYPLTEV